MDVRVRRARPRPVGSFSSAFDAAVASWLANPLPRLQHGEAVSVVYAIVSRDYDGTEIHCAFERLEDAIDHLGGTVDHSHAAHGRWHLPGTRVWRDGYLYVNGVRFSQDAYANCPSIETIPFYRVGEQGPIEQRAVHSEVPAFP